MQNLGRCLCYFEEAMQSCPSFPMFPLECDGLEPPDCSQFKIDENAEGEWDCEKISNTFALQYCPELNNFEACAPTKMVACQQEIPYPDDPEEEPDFQDYICDCNPFSEGCVLGKPECTLCQEAIDCCNPYNYTGPAPVPAPV